MRPLVLDLDGGVAAQARLAAAVRARGGAQVAAADLGPALRLWSGRGALRALAERLAAVAPEGEGPELVFAGSGDFHHVTPLLVERALARFGGPATILHFDNHPDWARFARGFHCGSWVGRAARLPGVRQVITVGVCSPDVGRGRARQGDLSLVTEGRLQVFAWSAPGGGGELEVAGRRWPTIAAMGEAAFLDRLAASLDTRGLYVTIDKDVLGAGEAATNWDQGQASLDFVVRAVARACAGRRLIGADVVGDWSAPVFGGGACAAALKRIEAWMDQPRGPPPGADRLAANEDANLRLMALFAEVA